LEEEPVMPKAAADPLAGRDRSRLEHARSNGYLNASGRPRLVEAHGFWCWRLRVPSIWFERKSPRSRYGRVHLELFTTGHSLTEQGQVEMTDLLRRLHLPGRVVVSADEAHWDDIPERRLEALARTVLRVGTRLGNYELRMGSAAAEAERTDKVLPWRRSA
jgi:hypothetical protein